MTTDQTHDDWETLDWRKRPANPGDEVEVTVKLYGVTYVKSGVIVSFDDDGDPSAATDARGVIGEREYGTWRVRRKSLDPLADLTPGTIIRDVEFVIDIGLYTDIEGRSISNVAMIRQSTSDTPLRVILPYGPEPRVEHLTAFTTEDRTIRYIRQGDTWTAETLNGDTND